LLRAVSEQEQTDWQHRPGDHNTKRDVRVSPTSGSNQRLDDLGEDDATERDTALAASPPYRVARRTRD
jgi:hypothetical protein